jgi:hypothetical protein
LIFELRNRTPPYISNLEDSHASHVCQFFIRNDIARNHGYESALCVSWPARPDPNCGRLPDAVGSLPHVSLWNSLKIFHWQALARESAFNAQLKKCFKVVDSILKDINQGGTMLTWCAILFVLGILAFLDTIFSYGEIFRRVNSVVFMLVSLGLLVRTSMKMKIKRMEGLVSKVEDLEEQVAQLKSSTQAPRPREKEKTY